MRTHHRTFPCPNAPGFTLVELLVVITIITILAGLLLPALTKARSAAIMINCQSQQRQIAVAMQMYADESGGRLPALSAEDGTYEIERIGLTKRATYIEMMDEAGVLETPDSCYAGRWGTPSAIRGIWRCPALGRDPKNTLYGGGIGVLETGTHPEQKLFLKNYYPKLTSIKNPSSQAFLGDAMDFKENGSPWDRQRYGRQTFWCPQCHPGWHFWMIGDWHDDKTVAGFFDGHVRGYPWEEAHSSPPDDMWGHDRFK